MKLFLILLSTVFQFCNAANIVFLHTSSGYSHRLVHWPLVEALIGNGHNVTFIGPFGPSTFTINPKVHELQPSSTVAMMQQFLDQNFDVSHRARGIVPPLFLVVDYICYSICKSLVESEEIKSWLDTKPKVDLLISDFTSECGYGFVQKLGATKHILYVPTPMVTKHFEPFGIAAETSSIPDYDVSHPVPLNFLNRFVGTLLPLWYSGLASLFYNFGYKHIFEKELGLQNQLELDKAYELTNLVMINGDFISDYARSFPPFVVKVPGIHLRAEGKIQPLDNEIEDFINVQELNGNKTLGLVYISFGTVAKAPSLPIELRQMFFKTIESFPNLRFVWKWDGDKPKESFPPNVYFVKWIDQQKILAHPKILMFLTQAGRPSVQEAIDKGVPTITFPVLADQDFNADRLVNLGAAIGLDFVGLTQEKLSSAISTILTDDSYKSRALRLSQMSRDVPQGPVHSALFWVEFVLRYSPQELSLMKPLSRHLTFFTRRELDVWLSLFLFFTFSIYASTRILSKLLHKRSPITKIKAN